MGHVVNPAPNQMASRYEVLRDNEPWGLQQGDVVVGVPYNFDPGHRRNPEGKVTILWRESDGHRPDCNQYWRDLRRLRGRVPILWDDEARGWTPQDNWKRPLPRAKRNRRRGTPTRRI